MDVEGIDPSGDIPSYLDWALESVIWNGRRIFWTEASDLQIEAQGHILEMLLQANTTAAFEHLAAQLAWIGTSEAQKSFLAKDIQALDFSNGTQIIPAGFCKSICKFWKKHKKEILIGAGLLAVVAVVVVVATTTVTAAGAAIGGAAIGSSKKKEDEEPPSKKDDSANAPPPPPDPPTAQPVCPTATDKKLVFGEHGILLEGQYTSYPAILQELNAPSPYQNIAGPILPSLLANPERSWIGNFLETIGKGMIEPDLLNPAPSKEPETSARYITGGNWDIRLGIGSTNGMNTTLDEAASHANYLAKFASNQNIDWIYNRSHGPLIDLAEIFTLNYAGRSPNTGQLLIDTWTEFHERNAEQPQAKYLQFCHSQGAIHVRNALANAPKEIRDRVIVVAIAPGAVVPKNLCYQSYNYASKKDIVPFGELVYASALDTNEFGTSKLVETALENRDELILLDPHPDDTGIDHDFESPTFKDRIIYHINQYLTTDTNE